MGTRYGFEKERSLLADEHFIKLDCGYGYITINLLKIIVLYTHND